MPGCERGRSRGSWRQRCDSPAGGHTKHLTNAAPRCAGPSPQLACGQPARCVMPVSTRRGLHGSPGATRSCCRSRSSQDSCRGAPRAAASGQLWRCAACHSTVTGGPAQLAPSAGQALRPVLASCGRRSCGPGERLESRGGSAPANVLRRRTPPRIRCASADLRQDLGVRHGAGRQRPLDGRVAGVRSDLPAAPGSTPGSSREN